MRPGPTRVETYCSNDLLKVPRWRRSKLNTAISWLTPPSAALVTPAGIPAADASADMLCTKEWKSPPQRAAKDGVERRKTVSGPSNADKKISKREAGIVGNFLRRTKQGSVSIISKRALSIFIGICHL